MPVETRTIRIERVPTLADLVYRETFRKHGHLLFNPVGIRKLLVEARKFTLDVAYSAFLGELSYVSWIESLGITDRNKALAIDADGAVSGDIANIQVKKIEQPRHMARLPYAVTWFEFDTFAHHRRFDELIGRSTPEDVIPRLGFLMVQDDNDDLSYTCIPFADVRDHGTKMEMPFVYVWSADDGRPVRRGKIIDQFGADFPRGHTLSTLAVPYDTDKVGVIIRANTKEEMERDRVALQEFQGTLRHIWTFLASLGDVPARVRHAPPSGKFFAGGRIREFFSHNTISLDLPKGSATRSIARSIIARIRKRAHQVRGHWRRDWRHPGQKIWVHSHMRGDASLGFVTHDFAVTHTNTEEESL
jgi:hypothetical protein